MLQIVQRLFLTAAIFFFPAVSGGQQLLPSAPDADSLINLLSHKSGTDKVDLLVEISRAKWNISMEESLNYANEAYRLAEDLNYQEGKADALNRIGNVHYLLRDQTNVIENYNQAYKIARSLEDYRRMGMYLNNLGILFRELSQYDSSEVYLIRALRYKELHGDRELIASTLNNLGVMYRDMKRYNLSLEFFVRQLDMIEPSGDIRNIAVVHRQIGEVFYLLESYNESVGHFLYSIDFGKRIPDSLIIARANSLLARSLFSAGKPKEAMERIEQSIGIAGRLNLMNVLRDDYNTLYLYYKEAGNQKLALDHLIRHYNLKDSVQMASSETRLTELERIFETKKQESKIELLQKENHIQELQLGRQDNIQTLLKVLLALLIFFKLIIAYRFISLQKTNRLLKQKIGELENTNSKLGLSAAALEQLNATKNRFFSIIAHDLKNPFNSLLGYSEMMTNNFNQLSEEDIKQHISIIHQSSQNLYKLLENLLKWSAAHTGSMLYLPERFDLTGLIRSEIQFMKIAANKKQIIISEKLPDELIVNSDKLMLSSVIRNLTDNALKFTQPGGEIKLTALRENGSVYFEVNDTGIGMPEDLQNKLFRIDVKVCRRGTNNEEGGGLGLILCKELIEKAGGTIGAASEPGKGSRFWFRVPSHT